MKNTLKYEKIRRIKQKLLLQLLQMHQPLSAAASLLLYQRKILSPLPTVPLGVVQLFSISAASMQKMDSYSSYICTRTNFPALILYGSANLPAVQCFISLCIPLPS